MNLSRSSCSFPGFAGISQKSSAPGPVPTLSRRQQRHRLLGHASSVITFSEPQYVYGRPEPQSWGMVQFVTVVSGTTKLALKRRYVESTSYADALHIASPLCSPNLWPIGLRHSIRPPEPLDRIRHSRSVRGSTRRRCTNRHGPARCSPTGSSPADAIRHWSAEGGHPIQDLTAEDDFTPLPGWAPGAKTSSDDGRVAEERVLHPALTMVP